MRFRLDVRCLVVALVALALAIAPSPAPTANDDATLEPFLGQWSMTTTTRGTEVPATMILSGATDVYGEEGDPNGGVVYTGTFLLQGETGSWTGTQFGYFPPDPVIAAMTLEGEGAYEGLSAIIYQTYADAQAQQDDIVSFEGMIIEGELPPYPDVPVAATE